MSQETNKERQIFGEAIDLAAESRAAFIKAACGTDRELLKRVQELLDAYSDESPVLRTIRDTSLCLPKISESPGTRIGRYKLLQVIGEGGMGVVYMAEQEEPVRRRVALKIIKLGMDSRQVVARFEAERQALALMDHPNIARVLDGGATETGRPFFVMELVQGVPITEFCDTNTLSAKERLKLFIQVCQAIQSAHQKGIIHRDIKPSNVLVTLHHGEPMPKVIDFGIAKATNQKLTEKTLFTNYATMIGTPAYMSPEQAEMSSLDIDTRTDVYALGVLLYELLTGTTPFPEKRLRSLGYGEMQRVIMEEEPERPSTRLNKSLTTQNKDAAAETTIRNPQSTIDEDLDWIVMKCLEKNRTRRYDTANGLAMDLTRHLNNEPVVARPPSATYRFQKAFRRNKLAFAASGAVLLALLMGIAGSLWQALLATNARRAAQYEAYVAKMNSAQAAWEQNNVSRVRELLKETATSPERGFEWYYLQRQLHLELREIRGHTGPILAVAYSPDGHRIVTGSADKSARVWDAHTGQELFRLEGHTDAVRSVALSRDGQKIVTGSWDRTARVWDAGSGKPLRTLTGHEHGIFSVAVSRNGERIVTGSRDHTAKLWDANNGALIRTFKGHTGVVWSVAFSPDGERIVTGSWDKTVKVWSVTNGLPLRTFDGHKEPVLSVDFSPDGKRIVSGSIDHTAEVWEAATGTVLGILEGHTAPVFSVTFSHDGQLIATAGDDQTARVWNAGGHYELLTVKKHGSLVSSVAFSPDGQQMVTGGGYLIYSPEGVDQIHAGGGDQTAKVWHVSDDRGLLILKGHTDNVLAVTFSPDGQRIVTGSLDQTAKVWDASSGRVLRTLQGHTNAVHSVAVSRNGQRIVTGSWDGTAKVWDAASGELLFSVPHNDNIMIMSVTFSPDSKRIATVGQDSEIKVWDAATGKLLVRFAGESGWIWSVAFSKDGRQILTANEDPGNTAKLWDAATGEALRVFKGHEAWLLCAAFSPDSQRIVTCSHDQTVRLWDTTSGKELLPPLKGHSLQIMSASFSPDGRRIATCSRDQTVRVWDANTGKELLNLIKPRSGWIFSVAFSPDGKRIVAGNWDGTATVWEAATVDQVAIWRNEEQAAIESEQRARVAAAAEVDRVRAERANLPGGIKQWLVLGPMAIEGRDGARALQAEQIAQESRLRPLAGQRITYGQSELVWREVRLEDYRLDFNQVLGAPKEWSVAYAVCYIHSEEDLNGLVMKVGSDDQAKIFLNEREVYRITKPQSWEPDRDTVAGIELKAGLNVLVFKVVNERVEWGGSIRITDVSSQPIKGLQVRLTP